MGNFCNGEINIKLPIAISQNLVGIKKYAASWLVGYRYRNPIREAIVSAPNIRRNLCVLFLIFRPNPETQIKKGKRI